MKRPNTPPPPQPPVRKGDPLVIPVVPKLERANFEKITNYGTHLTGKFFFKKNLLCQMVLYVECVRKYGSLPRYYTRKAKEEDIIKLKLF